MKAMLFAAGLGTRLKPFTDSSPKSLAEVNHKSLLEHNVRYLQKSGIYEVIINVHHFAAQVISAVEKNGGFGSSISFSEEREMLLETGGGLLKASHYFSGEETFVVMNVDILTNLDLGKMIQYHLNRSAVATLAIMRRESSRELIFDEQMKLCGWRNKSTGETKEARQSSVSSGYAFSGIQVLSPKVFEDCPFTGKFSLIDLYLHLAQANDISGFDHTGDLLIDVGKPGSIEAAEKMFQGY